MNINSIRNKFDSVRADISNYVHIFIAVESFLTTQFAVDGFHKIGGILNFVRLYLPLRQLTKYKIYSNIQALVFEINLRKAKWFFLSLYKPPSQNYQYFLYSLYNTDFYSGIYDNHIVLGGFNMVPSHAQFLAVMEHYNYYNLIKKGNRHL